MRKGEEMRDDMGASASRPGSRPAERVDPSREMLKVWWIPQIPMKPFEVIVPDLATASAILDVLADYDAFQLENNVKGDYSNTGGLMILRDGEWEDWEDPATYAEFDEWRDENLPRIRTNGWGRPLSDSDQSGEAGQTAEQAGPVGRERGPEGHRPNSPVAPHREGQ